MRFAFSLSLFLLTGLGCLTLLFPANAQTNTIPFKHISLEEGLSQSAVQSFLQDQQGFLWIGTQNGLNRYDGYSFTVYQRDAEDSLSLSANWISALAEDTDGVLWVGTNGGGLNRFDPATGNFTQFLPDARDASRLPHGNVSTIFIDQEGTMWVGTYGGLSRFDSETGQFHTYQHDPQDPHSLRNNRALVVTEDLSGNLWIGTDRGGLSRLDRETGRFTAYLHDPEDLTSISANVILSLYVDQAGVLWIGTAGGGLNRFDAATEQFTHYQHQPSDLNSLSNDRVLSIREDNEGILWIGTDGGGLNRFDPANERFLHFRHNPSDQHSLSHDIVSTIYQDRSQVLWVGTAGGGLNKKSRFAHYKNQPGQPYSLSNNNIRAIHHDRTGVLWIGTDSNGLNRFDPETGQFTTLAFDRTDPYSLSHNRVLGITEDQAGRIWVATGNGLNQLTYRPGDPPEKPSFIRFQHEPGNSQSLSENRVFFAYEAPSEPGILWVGTWNGLNRFDPEQGTFTIFRHNPDDETSLSSNRIIAIHEDREGTLWVGTFGSGLNRFDRGSGQATRFLHDPDDPISLSQNIVASIYSDASATLWIGTGDGLNRFDPSTESFSRFSQRDGLPNNTIYSILEDDQGWLWMSTDKGLATFDPAHSDPPTFINYDISDGLQSNEFNQGAYHKSWTGEMFFGGLNGFNRFHPEHFHQNTPPPIVIPSFTSEEGSAYSFLSASQSITLDQEKGFSFEFAALDYSNPTRHQYAFTLDGYEATWHEQDANRRFASYTNLQGGTYTLRVRGANSEGIWNDEGVALTIHVIPVFWETAWFRSFLALAILGVLSTLAYTWHRVRIRRIERMRDERAEIQQRLTESREAERLFLAQELHDGAVQDLYGVRFSLEMVSGELAEEEAEPLNQGKELVQDVIQQLRVICGELRPPALAPFGLERAIRSHAERFQETNPSTSVVLDLMEDGQRLPDAMRLALYRIYQEAMNNIVKHAQAQEVTVRLMLNENKVVLEVHDDGRGFALPERWIELGRKEHYGLLGISERADGLGGHLHVASEPGQGTTVRVTVPHPPVSV